MLGDAARRVLGLWRDRIHPSASGEQVAVAFALLGGGLVAAIGGVLVVVLGDLLLALPFLTRELGIVAAALGLPLFLLGLVVALPARLWLRATSGAGMLLAAVGIALFSLWYPAQWSLTIEGRNLWAIGTYLAGVSLLSSGAVAATANSFIHRVRGGAQEDDDERGVTREEIDQDLKDAARQGWSWGGIRQGQPKVQIVLKNDIEPLELKGRGQVARLVGTPSSEADVQAAGALSKLRGRKKEATSAAVDSQVGSLRQLKAKKAAAEAARRRSWRWRLLHPWQALFQH